MTEALQAVRGALLRAAQREADARREAAVQDAAQRLASAQRAAEDILAEARRQGAADAATAMAANRTATRRQARAVVLAARLAVYNDLVARVHEAVSELTTEPEYATWLAALRQHARDALGPEVVIAQEESGGLTAVAGHRRLDLRLARAADLALEELAEETLSRPEGAGVSARSGP